MPKQQALQRLYRNDRYRSLQKEGKPWNDRAIVLIKPPWHLSEKNINKDLKISSIFQCASRFSMKDIEKVGSSASQSQSLGLVFLVDSRQSFTFNSKRG
ncbi:hypothetical protein RCO48_25440 [Peribacillus frigoritolerans]|nr:hypothetical protein [Peribacillus frigoritolerans]